MPPKGSFTKGQGVKEPFTAQQASSRITAVSNLVDWKEKNGIGLRTIMGGPIFALCTCIGQMTTTRPELSWLALFALFGAFIGPSLCAAVSYPYVGDHLSTCN